eukprot:scaffold133314_cov94-Phaeocystis_antarctica.AAC.2
MQHAWSDRAIRGGLGAQAACRIASFGGWGETFGIDTEDLVNWIEAIRDHGFLDAPSWRSLAALS